jgi:CRISPR-associated endonuclease/helicase Cas3
MLNEQGFFELAFKALTGHADHFLWQQEMFDLLKRDQIPSLVNLPTGTWKTSIIPIWVAALAWQAMIDLSRLSLPRRLVWVVDRRVVVDQATQEAARIADCLAAPENSWMQAISAIN